MSTKAEGVFELNLSFDKPGVPGAGVVKASMPGVDGAGIPGVNGAGRSAVRGVPPVFACFIFGVHSTAPTGVRAAAAPGVPGIVEIWRELK